MSEFDARRFADLPALCNEWCALHPERTSSQSIAELARFAGCSWSLMRRVLDKKRNLALKYVVGLGRGLALPEDQAIHLRRLAELQFAPPEEALNLRVEIWRSYAAAFGVPWDEASSQIHEVLPSEQVIAALGPVLAALGDEIPSTKRLVARSVVPLQEADILAAMASLPAWEAHRSAPRMITLPPPTDPASALVWHGSLGRAMEALGRAQPDQMRCTCIVAAVDAEAVEGLEKIDGRLSAKLAALAEEAELRPANRVVCVLKQVLPLTPMQRTPDPTALPAGIEPRASCRRFRTRIRVKGLWKALRPPPPL